ncbi:MAG TPA: hypothetical protein ENL35_08315, partial [Chloroflexi bacterium]|nr:hypothetical protein [Chloroflexota bacterium]
MRDSGSSSSEINLLFTSVGRRVELMNAFREAYARLGLRGRLVAPDTDPLAPALPTRGLTRRGKPGALPTRSSGRQV